MSSNKIIYVKIQNRIESIEFNSNTSTEDLKETFRSAAEANTNDIIKLYNHKGHMLSICSASLYSNCEQEAYRLEIIARSITEQSKELKELVERIEQLEFQLHSLSTTSEYSKVEELHFKVKELCQKLENLEHLSWLGSFKDKFSGTNWSLDCKNDKKEKLATVYEQFQKYSLIQVSDETRQYLKKPSFDNWKFEDAEMLVLLQQMFIDLGLTSEFAIKTETLKQYLFEIYANYNDVPFHNFRHAFVVTQMMYGLIWITNLKSLFQPLEILALIVSAISHDLAHDGYNNSFQVNAGTHLALIYNDYSPLEMYHCAVGFNILNKSNCNILSSLTKESFRKFREYMIQIILSTDMSNHNQILNNFNSISTNFDFKNPDHRVQLMKILMKTSDISNESRPVSVSDRWLECLLEEFFNQGDHEKLRNLPLTPLMDRDNFSKAKSQVGFISYVLLPLAESLSRIFPQINDCILTQIKGSLEYYKNMPDSS